VTKFFTFSESFLAFLMAVIIVAGASYTFPLYFVPICFILMGTFLYYVFGQKEKGTLFIVTIYVLVCLNAIFLLWTAIVKLVNKDIGKSSLFYAQKMRIYREYTAQLLTGKHSPLWGKK
jgi:uncharacterized RDD family membrane protein YckC